MNAAEVVVHVEQRDRVHMVVELLGKLIGQTGEPTHVHAPRQVLPFDVARSDVLRVRVAGDCLLRSVKLNDSEKNFKLTHYGTFYFLLSTFHFCYDA